MDKETDDKTQLAFWGDQVLRVRLDEVARKLDRSRAYVLKKCVEVHLDKLEEECR